MTYQEILKNLDKSKPEEAFFDLAESMDIYEYITEDKLVFYWVKSWICTDTMVGLKVYFYNDKAIAIGIKPYRKYDLQLYWINIKTYEQVRKYIESLIKDDEYNIQVIDNNFDFTSLADKYYFDSL